MDHIGQNTGKNYILVVNNEGDTNILNLSYDFNWQDVSLMLEVKFGYENTPKFSYTDQEEDSIILDSQEAFEEALKIAKQNSDVLHVQMRKMKPPVVPPRRSQSTSSDSAGSVSRPKDHVEIARAAFDSVVDWTSQAVKSAFNQGDHTVYSASGDISMQSVPEPTEFLSEERDDHPKEIAEMSEHVDAQTTSQKNDKLRKISMKEINGSSTKPNRAGAASVDKNSTASSSGPSPSAQKASEETSINMASHDDILQKIKEEVRLAISQELSALRNELSASTTQHIEQRSDAMSKSTVTLPSEGPRSPRRIKDEIKSLRKEIKEARALKQLNKQAENSSPSNMLVTQASPKKARKYAASFICENLLDGSCVVVGQQFVKYWVLKNEGTSTWDQLVELKLLEETPARESASADSSSRQKQVGGATSSKEVKPGHVWGPEHTSLPIPRAEANGTAVIAVSHIAPSFPCNYTSTWRLSHNGRPFGPRIWCSVDVKTHQQLDVHEQSSMSMLSSIGSAHSGGYSLDSSQYPSSSHPTIEEAETRDHSSDARSFHATAVVEVKAETPVLPDQTHHSVTNAAPAPEEQQAENSTEEDIYELDQKQVEDTILRDSFEEAVSGFTSLDVVTDRKAAKHITKQEEEVSSESEGEVEVSPDPAQERRREELDVDDESSMMSDFEVIPMPECFDTTRPLAGLENAEEEGEENSSSLLSNSTLKEEDHSPPAEEREEIPEAQVEEEDIRQSNEDSTTESEEDSSQNEEESAQSKEDKRQNPKEKTAAAETIPPANEETLNRFEATASTTDAAQPSTSQLVAPSPIPVPQSVIDLDKPLIRQKPLPVPQSVLDMDQPSPVRDYSEGYNNPRQRTAPAETPWSSAPIPLPRGVLDANKPWVRSSTTTVNTVTPLPCSATVPPQLSTRSSQRAWDARLSLDSSIVSSRPDEEVESPQIYYPPQGVEEYTLAPEPSDSQPPILVSPDYYRPPAVYVPRPSTQQNPDEPAAAEEDLPPFTPSPMEQLIDMGFCDIEMNKDLLAAFQGDMARVVNALVFGDHSSLAPDTDRDDGTFVA